MRKLVPILVAILVIAVSWIFFKNFTVTGLHAIRVVPKYPSSEPSGGLGDLQRRVTELVNPLAKSMTPPRAASLQPPSIRVGSFNVNALTIEKISEPKVLDLLARIGSEFDVLALQELRAESQSVFSTLVRYMNRSGSQYDYIIGPRVGPRGEEDQFAFIYNRRTLLFDRTQLYTVDDRSNVLTYEPLVAWFRVIGPPADQAFTFSLVNVRLDPTTATQEHEVLDDLFVAVRDDGRNEDDVVLAGDLGASPGHLGPLSEWDEAGFAVSRSPTDVTGETTLDNIVFHKSATVEFTGHSGVLDYLRRYNLTLDEALAISDHLIVWAEFSVLEGGTESRRVAQGTSAPTQ